MNITYKEVSIPKKDNAKEVILLEDHTIENRKKKLLELMKEFNLSSLIIYADKEHGGNFEYLTGFIPRFEEALQILNKDGSSTLVLGNENFNKAQYSRTKADSIKCPMFSLPNQPMPSYTSLSSILQEIEIDTTSIVGVVGWKLIPGMTHSFDVPNFIIETLKNVIPDVSLVNATDIYIDPNYGARTTNNANEIAHYEYGASLASDAILEAMDGLEAGVSELQIGDILQKDGQSPNVVTIAAFGQRFENANVYPTQKKLNSGDKVSLTVSYRGGLSSRSGYAVKNLSELSAIDPGYYEEVIVPYFKAYNNWLQNLKIGVEGNEFYKLFEENYPQSEFGWGLCPGHLVANEEWLSSPFYKGSKAVIKSGMIFQVDFIPSQKGHNGVSAESSVAIADESLRKTLKENYPDVWNRIQSRKEYMNRELNIQFSEELLPLASTLGYYRPFMLDKNIALVVEKNN